MAHFQTKVVDFRVLVECANARSTKKAGPAGFMGISPDSDAFQGFLGIFRIRSLHVTVRLRHQRVSELP